MSQIEVVDTVMDDDEIAEQNDMFERIMDVCGGEPSRRVLQVLVDVLTCAAVTTGHPLDELTEAIALSYADALPKDGNDN